MRAALLSTLVLATLTLSAQAPTYDVIISGGRVLDGSGNPWFRADIGIRGDVIAALGRLDEALATTRLEANGLIVAPGFIDIHNHGGEGLERVPTAENYVRQGVTTLIEGNDGSSPIPLGPFLEKLARLKKSVNIGYFAGHGSLRRQVAELNNRPVSPDELATMKRLMAAAMTEGAFGLSTGLFYVPGNFASTEEVIAIARVAGEYGGIHISHMRDEASGVLASVQETIRIGEEGYLPTQVTHHKIIGAANHGASTDTLRLVEEARARGVDVSVDAYPYTASSTGTAALFPRWALEGGGTALNERLSAPESRARIKAEIVTNIRTGRGGGDPKNVLLAGCGFDASLAGKTLAEVTASRGKPVTFEDAAETAIDIQRKGGCSAIYHAISEQDVERILAYPGTMVASDGTIPVFGRLNPHPRGYGTFSRVLGRYVRERGVIRLEDGIRKMTGLPSQRLKLWDRGLVRVGMKADLTVFDPTTVIDRSEFLKPHQYSEGVKHVLVNGRPVLSNGVITVERPGRVLYGPGYRPGQAASTGR